MLVLLLACQAEVPDADGDGVPADLDCDDADADRFPGSAEHCDGRDNNCDGAVDESPGSSVLETHGGTYPYSNFYAYDAEGRTTLELGRDEDGLVYFRRISAWLPDSSSVRTETHAEAFPGEVTLTNSDARGNPLRYRAFAADGAPAADTDYTNTYQVDEAGRLIEQSLVLARHPDHGARTGWVYDEHGRVVLRRQDSTNRDDRLDGEWSRERDFCWSEDGRTGGTHCFRSPGSGHFAETECIWHDEPDVTECTWDEEGPTSMTMTAIESARNILGAVHSWACSSGPGTTFTG